jgi:hypothetical protein
MAVDRKPIVPKLESAYEFRTECQLLSILDKLMRSQVKVSSMSGSPSRSGNNWNRTSTGLKAPTFERAISTATGRWPGAYRRIIKGMLYFLSVARAGRDLSEEGFSKMPVRALIRLYLR